MLLVSSKRVISSYIVVESTDKGTKQLATYIRLLE